MSPVPGRPGRGRLRRSLAPLWVFAALSLGACDDAPTPPVDPTTVAVLRESTPATSVAGPAARPTWTLPPGVGEPVAAATEIIPVPTPEPEPTVGADGPALTDPDLVALMARVEQARLASDVRRLVDFGTRHVLSVPDDPERGIGAAREWIYSELESANVRGGNQLAVNWEPFQLSFAGRTTEQSNVVATIPGFDRPKRFVYVTAHYDSRTDNVADGGSAAPGADDNASGTAVVLELARVLAHSSWAASIRLVAFAAEEQGMKGSEHHASAAADFGLPILGVFNNDIVGSTLGADGVAGPPAVRLLSSESEDSPSRRLARWSAVVGPRYVPVDVELVPRADRDGRNSDHVAFSEEGYPALRVIAGTEDLTRQHNAMDTFERIDPVYMARVAQLNIALAGTLALAPPAPAEAPRLDRGAEGITLTWDPVDHAQVAGYWVAVRGAGEERYRPLRWVPGTEVLLAPEAGVRVAVATSDAAGHMSLFSPETAPYSE